MITTRPGKAPHAPQARSYERAFCAVGTRRGIDRAATAQENGAQGALSWVLVFAVGAGDGLRGS
jgi:hypothetical protein